MAKHPQHYKLHGGQVSAAALDAHLKGLLMRNLQKRAFRPSNRRLWQAATLPWLHAALMVSFLCACGGRVDRLAAHGMIAMGDDGLDVKPLLLGMIMAKFCIEFDTVCAFPLVDGATDLSAVVTLLANATEFKEPLYLRHNEKSAPPPTEAASATSPPPRQRPPPWQHLSPTVSMVAASMSPGAEALFVVNSSSAIRFPLMEGKKKSKVKTAAMKASLLLQLRAGGHPLNEFRTPPPPLPLETSTLDAECRSDRPHAIRVCGQATVRTFCSSRAAESSTRSSTT